jgi:protein TonB
VPIPVTLPKPADPGPVEPETAAPKTLPAPAAPQMSGNAADTWEGRVLAALHKQRRYPRNAMMRRQQGVPYIRFTMDREGKVLSVRLERSCGFPELDREAVALARRASPLPKPPDDKPGDTLELVVPVEYFLAVR